MLNTVSIGDIGEAQAIAKFIASGFIVSKPLTNNARYDLIVEINSSLYRVQVKSTSSIKDGKMEFATKTTNYVKGQWKSNSYSKNDIDLFFLFCVENNWCGIYNPSEDEIVQQLNIRVEPPKNNQRKGIRLAEDYEFSKQIQLLIEG